MEDNCLRSFFITWIFPRIRGVLKKKTTTDSKKAHFITWVNGHREDFKTPRKEKSDSDSDSDSDFRRDSTISESIISMTVPFSIESKILLSKNYLYVQTFYLYQHDYINVHIIYYYGMIVY